MRQKHAALDDDFVLPPLAKGKRRCQGKGQFGRRIIVKIKEGGREYTYHATKGWRCSRA